MLTNIAKLEPLSVSLNRLASLDVAVFAHNVSLKALFCFFVCLPLPYLVYLLLTNNNCRSAFRNRFMENNTITSLPSTIFDQLDLHYLYGTDFLSCVANFKQLLLLVFRIADGNALTTLPSDLFDNVRSLRELYVRTASFENQLSN